MKMKIFSVVSMLTLSLSVSVCADFQKKHNDISVVVSSVNFGSVQYGDTVRMESLLKNTGNKPITISYVETTCDCSLAKARNVYIEKGDSTIIDITYRAIDVGYVERNLAVHFIDSPQKVNILMKGRVRMYDTKFQ